MSDQQTTPPGTPEYVPAPPPPMPVAPPPMPVAAPPYPGVQPAVSPAPPKKKGRGCLIGCLAAVALAIVVVVVGVVFVSSLGKPRDLGVRYTPADYHSAAKKLNLSEFASAGSDAPVDAAAAPDAGAADPGTGGSAGADADTGGGAAKPTGGSSGGGTKSGTAPKSSGGSKADAAAAGDPSFETEVIYTGSKPFDAVLTSAEISALLNYSHAPGWPISQAQVVFTGSDGFMMSMYFEYMGVKYPVYCEGVAGINGGSLNGLASSAQVMGVTVPSEYLGPGSEYVAGVINDRLARLGTLDVTQATVADGGLHLVGTGPAESVPSGQ